MQSSLQIYRCHDDSSVAMMSSFDESSQTTLPQYASSTSSAYDQSSKLPSINTFFPMHDYQLPAPMHVYDGMMTTKNPFYQPDETAPREDFSSTNLYASLEPVSLVQREVSSPSRYAMEQYLNLTNDYFAQFFPEDDSENVGLYESAPFCHEDNKPVSMTVKRRGRPRKNKLPSESEIALAAICDDIDALQALNSNKASSRKQQALKPKQDNQPSTSELPKTEREEFTDPTQLLDIFLQTSRDEALVRVLRDYGCYVEVNWIKTVLPNGPLRVEPLSFKCRIPDCCFETHLSFKLIEHLETSSNCQHCPRRFHTEQGLAKHVEACHRRRMIAGRFLCEDCSYTFQSEKLLNYHRQNIHFRCLLCIHGATNADELAEHLLENHNGQGLTHVCELCQLRFLTTQQLALHRLTDHRAGEVASKDAEKSVSGHERKKCHICGKKFSKVSLRIHIRRHHHQEKRYQCEFCDYEAFDTYMLKEHTRRHLGEFNYQCDYCDFRAVKKYQLDSHMRRHTGDKPFRCEQCDFAAAWNVQLKTHRQVHNSSCQVKCNDCNIVFKNERQLNRHNNNEHFGGPRRSGSQLRRKTVQKVKVVRAVDETKAEHYRIPLTTCRRSSKKAHRRRSKLETQSPKAEPESPEKLSADVMKPAFDRPQVNVRRDELMHFLTSSTDRQFEEDQTFVVVKEDMI